MYKLPSKEKKETQGHSEAYSSYTIPLSPEAKDIQEQVSRPIQARTLVGYSIQFLDEYRPNSTYYLSETILKRLFEIGKTDGEQPAGTFTRKIFGRLLIDLSWNSSRLEGNTYSLLETERLFELSRTAEGKDLREAGMILNHKDAIEFLIDTDISINRLIILNLHALLSNDLMVDLEACGRLRSIAVGIGKSVYQPISNATKDSRTFPASCRYCTCNKKSVRTSIFFNGTLTLFTTLRKCK